MVSGPQSRTRASRGLRGERRGDRAGFGSVARTRRSLGRGGLWPEVDHCDPSYREDRYDDQYGDNGSQKPQGKKVNEPCFEGVIIVASLRSAIAVSLQRDCRRSGLRLHCRLNSCATEAR